MRHSKSADGHKWSRAGGPRLGAHMSIAGGVDKALLRGEQVGCDTIQIFTKNNNQWRAKPLTDQGIRTYREQRDATGIWPVIAHGGYLINIASPKRDLHRRSVEALRIEVGRATALEIPTLIIHPGAHLGRGEGEGIRKVIEGLNTILERTKTSPVTICLETTAGQGSSLGYCFEHLAAIRDGVSQTERLGVCVDTCHIFAAGYEIRGRRAYEETMRQLQGVIGLKHVRCIHLNDSQRALGSRVDRHAHIGRGEIGLAGFQLLVNDPRLRHIPMILETPKGEEPIAADRGNLAVLRSLIKGACG
ncbi:MAG: deoxyribonuclease IV [Candidatus Methylomirabilales bacterium]